MGQAAFEGVAHTAGDVDRQPRRLDRIEFLADLDELAQAPPFDELHHEEMDGPLRKDLVDRDDVGMAERAAQLAFAHELAVLLWIVAEPAAEDFEGHDLPRLPMDRAIHPSEGSRANQIQDLIVAKEEAGAFSLEQAFDLVVRKEFAADEELHQGVEPHIACHLGPDLLKLNLIQQSQIEDTLSNLFSGWLTHRNKIRARE